MPFRKKFPAMKYYLGCSISQLPPPLSCLQCYLCDCNQRLQIRAGFCYPTSSEWDFRYWCSGWDFRCWCSALGFPGIVLQPKILLQDEDWAQVSWEFLLDLFWTEFNLVPQKWKIYFTSCYEKSLKWVFYAMFWWMWTCGNWWCVKRHLMLCLWWRSPDFNLMVGRAEPKSFHLFIWDESCKAPNPDFSSVCI